MVQVLVLTLYGICNHCLKLLCQFERLESITLSDINFHLSDAHVGCRLV